jgi:hypothetical protein
MRYYAEWLDGEYVLLDKVWRGYSHKSAMERSLRFHALFGSTLVLSDAQTIDFRNPIPGLFLDSGFQLFLREHPDYLALVAEPVRGKDDEKFAVAVRGIQRLIDQTVKPSGSYEEAMTAVGELLVESDGFDKERLLTDAGLDSGQTGRILRRHPQHRRAIRGVLRTVAHFATAPGEETTARAKGQPGRYDELLRNVRDTPGVITESQAHRIDRILEIQSQIPVEEHGRRASIRKRLGLGEWHNENWSRADLRLYLDVVHAWNCTINRVIAPDAGTLYESGDDLALSRFHRQVTDRVEWKTAVKGIKRAGIPKGVGRLLAWDPLSVGWDDINGLVDNTQDSGRRLQRCLKAGDPAERADALVEHATRIAECLDQPLEETPKWWWDVLRTAVEFLGSDGTVVEVAEQVAPAADWAYASIRRKLVVNSIATEASTLLSP